VSAALKQKKKVKLAPGIHYPLQLTAGIKASVLASQGLISKQIFNSGTSNNTNNNDADDDEKKGFLSFCLGLRRGATLKPSHTFDAIELYASPQRLANRRAVIWKVGGGLLGLVSLRLACVETGPARLHPSKGEKGRTILRKDRTSV